MVVAVVVFPNGRREMLKPVDTNPEWLYDRLLRRCGLRRRHYQLMFNNRTLEACPVFPALMPKVVVYLRFTALYWAVELDGQELMVERVVTSPAAGDYLLARTAGGKCYQLFVKHVLEGSAAVACFSLDVGADRQWRVLYAGSDMAGPFASLDDVLAYGRKYGLPANGTVVFVGSDPCVTCSLFGPDGGVCGRCMGAKVVDRPALTPPIGYCSQPGLAEKAFLAARYVVPLGSHFGPVLDRACLAIFGVSFCELVSNPAAWRLATKCRDSPLPALRSKRDHERRLQRSVSVDASALPACDEALTRLEATWASPVKTDLVLVSVYLAALHATSARFREDGRATKHHRHLSAMREAVRQSRQAALPDRAVVAVNGPLPGATVAQVHAWVTAVGGPCADVMRENGVDGDALYRLTANGAGSEWPYQSKDDTSLVEMKVPLPQAQLMMEVIALSRLRPGVLDAAASCIARLFEKPVAPPLIPLRPKCLAVMTAFSGVSGSGRNVERLHYVSFPLTNQVPLRSAKTTAHGFMCDTPETDAMNSSTAGALLEINAYLIVSREPDDPCQEPQLHVHSSQVWAEESAEQVVEFTVHMVEACRKGLQATMAVRPAFPENVQFPCGSVASSASLYVPQYSTSVPVEGWYSINRVGHGCMSDTPRLAITVQCAWTGATAAPTLVYPGWGA